MANTQVKVTVDSELAATFKTACIAADASMASVLAGYMAAYSQTKIETDASSGIATRRQRRAVMKRLITQLEMIKAAEERYRDNIPENLKGSSVYDRADESVSVMEEAAELLSSVYIVP
jgi:hypothetical protein